jgi:hypothetical protein
MAFARVFGTVGDMATSSPESETLDRDAIDVVEFDATGVLCSFADDVGESPKLPRERSGLSGYITGRVISEDVQVRAPDPEAFTGLCRRLDAAPFRVLLIDDREESAAAARAAGPQALRFGTPALSRMDRTRAELRPW